MVAFPRSSEEKRLALLAGKALLLMERSVLKTLGYTHAVPQYQHILTSQDDVAKIMNEAQKIPDEFVPDLRESLVYVIVGQHLFRRVEDHTDDAVIATGPENVLQLKVRIVGYTGAQNNAGVSAMVHFIDKQTGTEIFQRKVDAHLIYDQGALTSALRKLGRSIGDVVKDNW